MADNDATVDPRVGEPDTLTKLNELMLELQRTLAEFRRENGLDDD